MEPKDLRVMIGMPAYKEIAWQVNKSLLATFRECAAASIHVELKMIAGSAVITKARSDVVNEFLQSDCNRLFWIDSDIEWTPLDFGRLLALTTDAGLHVVGATYPSKSDPMQYFVKIEALETPESELRSNEHGCMPVDGFGLGFTCITREAVEAVANKKPWIYDEVGGFFCRDVFRVDHYITQRIGGPEMPGCPEELYGKRLPAFRGEDMAFFHDLKEAGYQPWLYPFINLGHIGQKTYRGDLPAILGITK